MLLTGLMIDFEIGRWAYLDGDLICQPEHGGDVEGGGLQQQLPYAPAPTPLRCMGQASARDLQGHSLLSSLPCIFGDARDGEAGGALCLFMSGLPYGRSEVGYGREVGREKGEGSLYGKMFSTEFISESDLPRMF